MPSLLISSPKPSNRSLTAHSMTLLLISFLKLTSSLLTKFSSTSQLKCIWPNDPINWKTNSRKYSTSSAYTTQFIFPISLYCIRRPIYIIWRWCDLLGIQFIIWWVGYTWDFWCFKFGILCSIGSCSSCDFSLSLRCLF